MITDSARWIWYDNPDFDLVNSWMDCRGVFRIKKAPQKVIICVTADTQYRLYINGKHIHQGPARGFQKSWPYDEIDIVPFLRAGKNVIAARVHQMGISTFQYIHQGYAGFLLWGKVGGVDLSTGPKWKVRKSTAFKRDTRRVSLQLGFQEHFDARLDDEKWIKINYDDKKWLKPNHFVNPGSMPWHSLEPREIPLLKEKNFKPERIIATAKARCRQDYRDVSDVVQLFCNEKKKWKEQKDSLTQTKDWAYLKILKTGPNRYHTYILDFGKEMVGSIRLKIKNGRGGEIIDTLVCETLTGITPDIFSPDSLHSRQAFGNRLILRKGITEHEAYDYWGFRYLILVARDIRFPLTAGISLRWVGYPLEIKASFETSGKKLNRIYGISTWTQQSCMQDSYVDCPWREQAQWWGDARVQAKNTFYLSADARLFRRGIKQIGTQEVPIGLTYGHAPTMAHFCILPDFTLTWILTHWDYYWQTGDFSLFNEMRERIHRALDFFERSKAKNGLLPYDDRYWLFLDWCDLFKAGYSTLYNLFYLWVLRVVGKLFSLINDKKSSMLYKNRERQLLYAIKKRLFDNKRGLLYGGLSWKGKPVIQDSPHIQALTVLLDLFLHTHKDIFEKRLIPFVSGNREDKLIPSPFFMFYIFEALKKGGYNKEVIDCILRWWGEMVDAGSSTTWEVWKPQRGQGSRCHAWSAHPIVHFSNILLGIWQTKPGWREIRFSPMFLDELNFCQGKVSTPLGAVETSWERKSYKIDVNLVIPKGIHALINLPNKKYHIQGKKRTAWKWLKTQ